MSTARLHRSPKPRIALTLHAGYLAIQCLDQAAPTGLFFDQQTPSAVVAAVQRFEAEQHRINACRDNALRFAPETERFRAEFTAFVEGHWQAFQNPIHSVK